MKKCRFYTRLNDNDTQRAVQVKGYTDGCWFYYHSGAQWHVVDSGSGLAIPGIYYTRKAAQEAAYSDEMVDRLSKYLNSDYYHNAVECFHKMKADLITVTRGVIL